MKSKILSNSFSIVVIFLMVCYVSCRPDDDIQDDIDSLIGEWKVVQIKSFYGEFVENGHNGLTVLDEEGNLGSFTFNDFTSMEYLFTRNDTLYANDGTWSLKQYRFREIGFFEATRVSMIIPEQLVFDINFKNSTRANSIQLSMEPEELGFGIAVELFLEKTSN